MANDAIRPEDVARVRDVVEAIAEAIQGLGQVPSGELYARLMNYLTAAQYEAVITLLVQQRRVRRDGNHLLTWIGGS